VKTGKDVLTRALQLLGYVDSLGNVDSLQDAELMKRGTTAVMQIYNDIQRVEKPSAFDTEPFNMADEIKLSAISVNDVMPYGVAMLIADIDNNGVAQAKFADIYNQKRKSIPRSYATRIDVIPGGGY
jgi:hypothetical protein